MMCPVIYKLIYAFVRRYLGKADHAFRFSRKCGVIIWSRCLGSCISVELSLQQFEN